MKVFFFHDAGTDPNIRPRRVFRSPPKAFSTAGIAFFVLAFVIAGCGPSSPVSVKSDNGRLVVLLHGLARSYKSMAKMQKNLEKNGFGTCNVDYPSTEYPVGELSMGFVLPAVEECIGKTNGPVDFVAHSMGGIVVRYLAKFAPELDIGRVVMLSPPNRGSEAVDVFGEMAPFEWINGPAGKQLGTDKDSLPNTLGPAYFELGIITGNRSINWILSAIIEGEDDGKVSVENAGLEGMKDFLVVPASHPFIMKDDRAIEQTSHFLEHGRFSR